MKSFNIAAPPLPIDWHEGMLLAPEHFQILADRIDALSQYYIHQVMPFHWGIIDLDIDPSLLLQGTLRVDLLDAILPDGLVISGAGVDGELQVDLASREQEFKAGPLMIHVVAARSRGYAHGQSRFKSVESKFESFGEDVESENPLPLLAPRLELWTGANPPSRFVSLPLIEIERRHDGYAATSFQPPVPRLQTAERLVAEIAELALEIRKKSLSVLEDSNGPYAMEATGPSLDARTIVAALSAELPALEAIITCAGATPVELHRSLLRVTGRLAVLGDLVVPPVFGPYQHNALNACFRPLIDFVQARLASIQLQTQEIPFTGTDDHFELLIQPEWIDRQSLLIGLRCHPNGDPNDVAAWFGAATIASAPHVDKHIANRMIGAERQRVVRDDGMRLAAHSDLLLYRLDWQTHAEPEDNRIVIVNRLSGKGQQPPRSIVLYVAPTTGKNEPR